MAELKAGVELDALVAESVMGWRVHHRNTAHYVLPGMKDYKVQAHVSEWHPSTDIAAAMEVWQKLRESGQFCCLEIGSDYHYCWTVSITVASHEEGGKHEPDVRIDGIEGGLQKLAYAICVAALEVRRTP